MRICKFPPNAAYTASQLEIRAVREFVNSRQKHTSAKFNNMLHSDLSGNPRFEHALTENSRCVTSILARVHRK